MSRKQLLLIMDVQQGFVVNAASSANESLHTAGIKLLDRLIRREQIIESEEL